MSKDNGGNAFPVADYDHMAMQPATVDEHKRQLMGMTLRDYFAAKAMPLAWKAAEDGYFNSGEDSINADVATCAYQMADAMLAARTA
uniref:Gp38 n=4 Tax=unclassified bacterial viruses TaxID=12333 RepID=A0AAU6W440_9VIRU